MTFKAVIFILFASLSTSAFAGGGDSLSGGPVRRPFFRFKKQEQPTSPVIERMSDDQLLRLVDHMFEAEYMPPDLWNQVMLETAKRNLSKTTCQDILNENPCELAVGTLHIQRLQPDSVEPVGDDNSMFLFPANHYYSEWDEDINNLFRDEFPKDTNYVLELENSEFGCFHMPAWGPLSSPFGWRHKRYHKGIDIQLRKGDTIVSAFDGMVRFAQKKGGYGNVVIVRHYNGLETVYGHLSKIKVQDGQVVAAGDLIGLAGNTGKSTGPHLHFEMRFKGLPVNPEYFIDFDYGSLNINTIVFQRNKSGFLAAYSPDVQIHLVERGETLAELANRYGTTPAKIRSLNGMTPKQYVRMKAGMVLKVREASYGDSASK